MDRKVEQAILVDQVVLDEGVGERAATGTWSSSPGSSLSLVTSAATSLLPPPSSEELCQSTEVSVVEATYFGSALSLLATGSAESVTRGQWPLKIW